MPHALVMVRRITPFLFVHFAIAAVFVVPFAWWLPLIAALTYAVLLTGSAGWMHRYFSHRCFRTSRWFQALLAFWGGCAAQRGALWWAAHHRRHHAFSDDHDDPHSPLEAGFWHAHVAWIWADENQDTDSRWVKDLWRYPELRVLDRLYWIPPLILWTLFGAVGFWYGAATGANPWLWAAALVIWGPIVGTVAAWHGTFAINSITHLWGRRRYKTDDESRNNAFVAFLNMGEGWHNNHHYYPYSANSGFYWWEFDPVYYVIVVFEKLGLVWDVKRAPKRVIVGRGRRAEGDDD
ncbi:MAG: acyl-CoA desaturase [Phycisphaerales bacterium]